MPLRDRHVMIQAGGTPSQRRNGLPTIALSSILALLLALALSPASQASELDDLLETFDKSLKAKKWPELATAARYLGDELAVCEKEADKKRIMDALTKGLRIYHEGAFVALRCAESLSAAGEDAAPILVKALRDRKLEKEKELGGLREMLVRSLGFTGSIKYVDKVMAYITHSDPMTAAAAAEGLSAFEEAPEKIRKKIAKALVDELDKAESTATAGNRRASSTNQGPTRYDAIALPFSATLQYLTGAEDVATKEWAKWMDENYKKKWTTNDD